MQRTTKENLLRFLSCLMNENLEVFPEATRAKDLETVWTVIEMTVRNPGETVVAKRTLAQMLAEKPWWKTPCITERVQ